MRFGERGPLTALACCALALIAASACRGRSQGFPGGLGGAAGAATGGLFGGGNGPGQSSGGGAGGAAGGTESPEVAVPCSSDEACLTDGQVCHLARGICVVCVGAADCEGSALCVRNECTPVAPCESSLDCESSAVVCVKEEGAESGFCLECGFDEDCDEGGVCVENACATACSSDRHCTPQGQLCNLDAGYCVDCIGSSGCQSNQYCDEGRCAATVCSPGVQSCVDSSVATCNAQGSGYVTLQSCGEYACIVEDGTAVCDRPPPPSGALNLNGDFAEGGTGWTVEGATVGPANPQNGRVCTTGNESFILGWPNAPHEPVELQAGQNYVLNFRAEVAANSDDFPVLSVNAKVGAPVEPFTSYGEQVFTSLTPGTHDLSLPFTMSSTATAGIALQPLAYAGEICLTEIWLMAD